MAVDASTSARGDLILKNLTKSYGDFNAVDDLSLVIPKGSFFALLGPSGETIFESKQEFIPYPLSKK